mmetsp:Transcript_4047/g.8410  ORF Transcript_4047/g.8410 Transcript_4047/m.8410 type:complete len:388 (-) Transcript_4047:238-1401(-)|eukprot:CAMPEP_0197280594 /NCGR_PEP_ID=MMETSP1432-20130617/21704_1 /TAXON_ID=44447 /ORGANISM="Pseudo-nitzschia delicatissima, Strain UNC1205" /LENGTH=387 /DNA_ID=CAMNT_0042747307 /DNA_START=63 /DNA_END=1226 /DNA_ORIENTATION=-
MSSLNTKNYEFTLASILLFVGSPLLLSGQVLLGGVCILLDLAVRASESASKPNDLHTTFNELSPKELIAKLNILVEDSKDDDVTRTDNESCDKHIADEGVRINSFAEGLTVLGHKYSKSNDKDELSLLYQELSFRLIRLHPQNDKVVAGSISLLAMVAKNAMVRERFVYEKGEYDLNRPITVLKKVLERAREEEEETKEEVLAEILRKGCLFLGAICSDGEDLGLASIIISEGGLELILEVANWFRMHEDVCNWALWTIFTLCYENLSIKTELVRSKGIQVICRLMENNPTSLEVNRHGTALLFDLMRENHQDDNCAWNSWEIRKIAIASGLHDRLFSAMNEFSDHVDIMMMGREILIGTGYRGHLPEFKQIKHGTNTSKNTQKTRT